MLISGRFALESVNFIVKYIELNKHDLGMYF